MLEEVLRRIETEAVESEIRQRFAIRQSSENTRTRPLLAEEVHRRRQEEFLRIKEEEKLLEKERQELLLHEELSRDAQIQNERNKLQEQIQAIREQDDAQRQRADAEASQIQRDIQRQAVRASLAKVASPAPSVASDGRLDAGPNLVYDESNSTDDLATLPIRQRAILKTILSDLPGNAPKYLITALESYDDELRVRGVQPILGLLKDIYDVIHVTIEDSDSEGEWLAIGLQRAFQRLATNHEVLVSHFPLDPEREAIYARTPVSESDATGSSFSEPFRKVADAARDANEAGLATDDFFKVIDKMAEFAKIISTIPPRGHGPAEKIGNHDSNSIVIDPADRVGSPSILVSAKKRVFLSGFGFFERVYTLFGTTVGLASTTEGHRLFTALADAINVLSKFLK